MISAARLLLAACLLPSQWEFYSIMISWSLAREIQIALAREERESLQLWRDSRERGYEWARRIDEAGTRGVVSSILDGRRWRE